MGPMNMSEKSVAVIIGASFLAGMGAMIALSNMMGWY